MNIEGRPAAAGGVAVCGTTLRACRQRMHIDTGGAKPEHGAGEVRIGEIQNKTRGGE